MNEIHDKLKGWNIKKLEILDSIQSVDLREDMFQVEKSEYLIDSGWYEGSSSFITYLIVDYNWEDPLIKIKSFNRSECIEAILFCLKYSKGIKKEIVS